MKTCNEASSEREIMLRDALQRIIDPEIGENIVDLGLVYGIRADEKNIRILMTMTSPACPMGEMLLDAVRTELAQAFPTDTADIELVWEPPWHPDMMSRQAKANLGWT